MMKIFFVLLIFGLLKWNAINCEIITVDSIRSIIPYINQETIVFFAPQAFTRPLSTIGDERWGKYAKDILEDIDLDPELFEKIEKRYIDHFPKEVSEEIIFPYLEILNRRNIIVVNENMSHVISNLDALEEWASLQLILVDTSYDALVQVEEALSTSNFTFKTFHYQPKYKDNFDPSLGTIEFLNVFERGIYLTDGEAANLMPIDRTVNYELLLKRKLLDHINN